MYSKKSKVWTQKTSPTPLKQNNRMVTYVFKFKTLFQKLTSASHFTFLMIF